MERFYVTPAQFRVFQELILSALAEPAEPEIEGGEG